MKTSFMVKSSVLVAVAAMLATGCVVRERVVYRPAPPVATVDVAPAPGEVVVTEEQPAPYVEVVPDAPRPGFVWVPGAWVWRNHWVWVRGRWDHPPRAGAVWVGGRYEHRGGGRVYIRGYWR